MSTRRIGLIVSATLLVTIAAYEGYRGVAYDDGVGVRTIGFGATAGVKPGDTITPVRALIRLHSDATAVAKEVSRCAPYPMHQHEFDAFVSLAYNIGGHAFCRSSIPAKLSTGDYAGACRTILDFNRVCVKRENGRCIAKRTLPGLTKRRQAEYQMCIRGTG